MKRIASTQNSNGNPISHMSKAKEQPATDDVVLDVKDLVTSFQTEHGRVRAVDGVSFKITNGKTLGVVGESGCGKSVTALSLMRLLPKPAGRIDAGEIWYRGENLLELPVEQMHEIRGNQISMIFQEPMSALNPVHKIGKQLSEVFELHFPNLSGAEVAEGVIDILDKVGIPAPRQRIKEYPHQLSGGMRQRVVIALALACGPDILIADEPSTALDVTIQAQILDLLQSLQQENNMAIMFITHDLGVIAELCDDVLVMYGGRVVESAPVFELFENPRHPYTRGLLASIPRLTTPRKSRLETIEGMVPALADMPVGCRFQNRCPWVAEICRESPPDVESVAENHSVRCYRWREVEAESGMQT